jgi:DNA-binding NtrC family response regulator
MISNGLATTAYSGGIVRLPRTAGSRHQSGACVSGVPNPVTVVAATGDDSFHFYFQEALAEAPATVVRACSNDEILKAVQRDRVSAVLFDQDTQGGHWRALLGDFAGIDRAPALIVSSRLADERLWAEVLNLGGFDLLLTPFRRDEVTRVVAAAIRDTQRGIRFATASSPL